MNKGRAADASGNLSEFADASQVSPYAVDAIKWAVGMGLIRGKDNHNIDPTAPATRAEICAILNRYLEVYNKILVIDKDSVK